MLLVYDKNGVSNFSDKHIGCSLTIGVFDGVHKGHWTLIKTLKNEAQHLKIPSAVLTFYPNPYNIVREKTNEKKLLICSLEERIEKILSIGINYVIVIFFTKAFSRLSYRDFFFIYLKQLFQIKQLTVGNNFAFGKDARGSIATLKELASSHKMAIKILELDKEPLIVDNIPLTLKRKLKKADKKGENTISSSLIRECISLGYTEILHKILGYYYSVSGIIVEGFNRGKVLGFPTLNLALTYDALIPRDGIYVGYVNLYSQKKFKAVIFVGEDMVFETNKRSIEAHIIDATFDNKINMYYKQAQFIFLKYLRENKGFALVESLKAAIKKDIDEGEEFFEKFVEEER